MAGKKGCPRCGAELPLGSPEGLCPKCLMAAALESGVATIESPMRGSSTPTSPDSTRFVPPEPASLAAHFPHLEILELLGHGGMGAVYKARQKNLDRIVALKIIRPEAADTPAFTERFNREARMLARLNHPHIVSIYDFGEVSVSDPGGGRGAPRTLYFFLMEYVDGSSLRQRMRSGDLNPEKALKVVPQICDALQYAHDEGIVHRDIKPENILLDKRGRVKIADFGLAKLAARSSEDFTLTATHHVLGTVRYMAPEQMEGSHAVDHRADIYSLGVVFYEMLTGEVPMGHFDPPSQKVEVDVRVDKVVLRALARQPERRYQQASEVKSDVETIRGSPESYSLEATLAGRASKEEVQTLLNRLATGLLVSGALSAAAALIVWLVANSYLAIAEKPGQQQFLDAAFLATTAWAIACYTLAVFVILGALAMMRFRGRWLAVSGSIVALLPWGLGWLIGLPIGFWSLRALNRRDVRSAFENHVIDPESLVQEIKRLANALLITGVLAVVSVVWLPTLVAIDWAVYGLPPVHPGSGRMGLSESALWLTLATGATICGVWLGIAAWKMSQLRSYEWVIIASVLAILPFSPAWIIGFPLGLWSLATLTRSAATRAFGRRKLQEAESALSGSSRTAQPHLGESERGYQHAIDVNEQVESTSKLPQSRKTLFEEGNTALHGLIVPAVGMLIAGTALTLLLGVAIFRGLPSDFKNWWVVGLGGPLLLLGGMAMKGGRSYWLAFAASLVCLAIGFATLYFIFLLPFVPIGLLYVGAHSLWQLMQPDVVEEFRQQSRSGISFGRRRLVITVTLVLPMLALVCAAPLFMAQLDKSRNMLARRDVKSRVGDEVASPAGAVDAPEPSPPSDVQDQPPAPPAPVQNETANVQLRGADENGAPPVMERSSRGEDANNANSVSGVVMFGEKGVSAEVILESPDGTQIGSIRSDDRGRFTFHDVAAGKYVLKVRGVARNQIRQAEQEITVLPRPQKPTDLTVELR